MATVNDITNTPLSGLNYIDALLDKGPDWNYLTTADGKPVTALQYTFSIASGNEDTQSAQSIFTGSAQAFSVGQQAEARAAFAYLSQVTGIQFVETASGTDAQIHLANVNLTGPTTTGLCSWHSSYGYSGGQLASYDADAYVYLDNTEWGAQNSNLAPGGYGYETLLHELGHALGLKHPFETTSDNSATLPAAQDSTANTLMSYNYTSQAYSHYQQDDLAALAWLYGGDGLGGALGIDSTTGGRYLMGSSGNDTLVGTMADDTFEGDGGNDMINGGGGNDTAVFRGPSSNYDITLLADGDLQVASKDGSDGIDTLQGVDTLRFADMSITHQAILAANSAPDVPTLTVTENDSGYAITGARPTVNGTADAGDTINIYTADGALVGTAKADTHGVFSVALNAFKDGTGYQIHATATNSEGVISAPSQPVSFNVDGHIPTLAVTENGNGYATGSTPSVIGSGEPGDTINIYTTHNEQVGTATVDSTGLFKVVLDPFADGLGYQIFATATSNAGVSTPSQTIGFNIDAHAPSLPIAHMGAITSGNTMDFSGTGEAGTTIELVRAGATADDYAVIAEAKVGADGNWSVKTAPLPNGDYTVSAVSVDLADNATSAASRMSFSVNDASNLTGTAGNDTLTPATPNIAIDGGAGIDTVVLNGSMANYTVAKASWGYGLTDNVGNGGHDSLLNVERIQFSDGQLALDIDGNAGQAYRVYQATFDRTPDLPGLGYWIWRMDSGTSLTQVAHEFMNQPEFDAMYGTNPSDTDFIQHLYENVLHREPDAGGFAYWLDVLHTSPNARADLLVDFSESAENKALVIGNIENGIVYTPWHTS